MADKKDLNVDEILKEIRKNRQQSVDDIFENAKKRISGESGAINTDSTEKTEVKPVIDVEESEGEAKGVFAEIITEKPEQETEKEEVTEETAAEKTEPTDDEIIAELFGKPEEDTEEAPEEIQPEEAETSQAESDEPSFKEMFEDKKRQKENASKTRVFKKVKEEAEVIEAEHTKINGQTAANEDELRLEKEFKAQRKDKIDNFRLFTENLTDSTVYKDEEQTDSNAADMAKAKKGEDIFAAVEKVKKPKKENTKRNEILKKRNSKVYEKIDVGRVKLELKTAADKNRARLITVLVATVLSGIAEIIKTVYVSGKFPALTAVMTEQSYIFYAIVGVLSIPVIAVCVDMFIARLKKSEKFTANNELFLLILCLCNLFHTAVQLVSREAITGNTLFFTLTLGVVVTISVLSDKKENEMIMRNLETITRNERILGIYSLGRDTDKLAAGISNSKEPTILCAGEVEVPDSFMDSSTIKDKQDNFMKYAIPCMLVFAVICAVIAKVTYGTLTALSTAFVSAALVTSPAFLAFILVTLISDANRSLNRSGCEILGYEAVEYIDDTDAIVLDTSEIFTGEISKFHVINSRSPIDTVHAFEITCAVLRESEGVLKGEVEGFIKEQNLSVPEVEELKYEEKLGLSCWVEDKCVLLGTRQMMIEHNLEVPPEYIETAYRNEGKKIFYLAYDSKVIAMFCAEYFIGMQAKKQLEKIYHTGIILMLMTTDPHIDETFVSNSIGVDISSIKTVNSTGMETIRKSIDKTAKQKRTGLIFKRNVAGLLRVINTAFRLYDVQSLTMLIQAISIGFAFAISAVLNIVATSLFFSPLMIVLYHLLWAGLSLIMTRKK